jgi:hypothetical protein
MMCTSCRKIVFLIETAYSRWHFSTFTSIKVLTSIFGGRNQTKPNHVISKSNAAKQAVAAGAVGQRVESLLGATYDPAQSELRNKSSDGVRRL